MTKFKVYTAGAFCPYKHKGKEYIDWRDFVKTSTNNPRVKFYDPRTDSRQSCPAMFTIDDANGVINSDILLHYRRRGYEDGGASWEHGIAFACNLLGAGEKLILYVDETNVPFPLHFASASLTFNSLETCVEFLNGLTSLEKKDFQKIWMKLLDRERAGR